MSNPIRILVAEDDPDILQGLIDVLESEGYDVTAARDGADCLRRYAAASFDLCLLDVMMPEKSGYDVCRQIRKDNAAIPIIILTAKSEEIDKVVGLELGADDYVTKPFGIHELLARIGAVLRRAHLAPAPSADASIPPPEFSFGPAAINRRRYEARLGKRIEPLTARELALIDYFYTHPDDVLSRDELLNAVWGIDYMGTTRTLDQHIAQLRKKVEPDPTAPAVILTVHGVGYRFSP
ncbi:MAG: response regulator transcription factor [Spartobacteria bacterium]|nr:response regulator transcription factor [Spartobacteria bacterium]